MALFWVLPSVDYPVDLEALIWEPSSVWLAELLLVLSSEVRRIRRKLNVKQLISRIE